MAGPDHGLLRAWSSERILANDRDLLVVSKPSGLVVHGGDMPGGDVVGRLAHWLSVRGEDSYLGVHQRLDRNASGVLFFTRRPELNSRVAADMEGHVARRSYIAAVTLLDRRRFADVGRLEHRLENIHGVMRVVARGGKLALSRYRVVEYHGHRALIELETETGRTHQLRAQLRAVGAPIAGDLTYGGDPAPRLMLHATRVSLPALGRTIEAPMPPELEHWLHADPPSLGSHERLRSVLIDAGVLRWPLAEHASALRLVNDLGDLAPGLVVDLYDSWAVMAVTSQEASERAGEIAELLVELGVRGVYLKLRPRGDLRRIAEVMRGELYPSTPLAGEAAPETLVVREGKARFAAHLADGPQTGLFVDQRDNRARITELARAARVLNLFCYTGSFSVAAARGGAAQVVGVDWSAGALERARQNFELNGLALEPHRFVREDVSAFVARLVRRKERFDVAVLDPPSFATTKRRVFRMSRDFAPLVSDILRVLTPGGRLLAITNHLDTSQARLRRFVHQAARQAGCELAQVKDLPSPADCPLRLGEPYPSKSVLVTVR